MNLITVGSRRGKTRHYIDADRYSRVSRSKALCGTPGSKLIMFDAVFFNYELVYPKMCAKCQAASEERFMNYDSINPMLVQQADAREEIKTKKG